MRRGVRRQLSGKSMGKTGLHKSDAKVVPPAVPEALLHVPNLRVMPEGKAVLLPGQVAGLKPRNVHGRFVKTSAKPLPGSSELQSVLAQDDRFLAGLNGDPPNQAEREYISDNIVLVERKPMTLYSVRPIHNRYYAIWMVGTFIGMAAVAWIVHYFHL